MKVLTIVGTRPELIKLSCVMAELDKHMDHVLVHTGQNFDFELNEVFFRDLEIRKPDYFLEAVGNSTAETIGNIIAKIDPILEKEQPDAVLLYGDTNSCLSVISAKRRRIPIFHMEAGNRCFDQRVPEEINRKIVDHTSDINMTLTEHARRYLIAEGIRPETVIKVGSSMAEIFNKFSEQIEKSDILNKLGLQKDEYFLISSHREENVDRKDHLTEIISALEELNRECQKKVIFSTHPRTKKRLEEFGIDVEASGIQFMKPLGFHDYNKLQMNAFCVLSDSGTITEEASLLKFPAVNLRNAHERPEGMDEGTVIMSGISKTRIIESVQLAVATQHEEPGFKIVQDYDVDNVSKKVVRIIQSYRDYVMRTVWKQDI